MKKTSILILLFGAVVSLKSQDIPNTGNPVNEYNAWGIDNVEEKSPNNRSAYVIQRHNGLSLSAHSYYGGLRFYNQETSSPYGYNGLLVMSITNGKVGIGTSTPQRNFDIWESTGGSGTVVPTIIRLTNDDQSVVLGDEYGRIEFFSKDLDGDHTVGTISAVSEEIYGRYGGLAFKTHSGPGTSLIERMRITSSGYIGIGTSIPQRNFDIWESAGGSGTVVPTIIRLTNDDQSVVLGDEYGRIEFFSKDLDGDHTVGTISAVSEEIYGRYGGLAFKTHSGPGTSLIERMRITASGNVGIGTSNTFGYKLAVNGTIGAKEVKVEISSAWPDYVFSNNYKLKDLNDVESFVNEYEHLPDMPTASEVEEKGVNLGEMDAKLLQKIEELTLYMIEMNKRMNLLESENSELKKEIRELKSVQ